MTLFAAGVTPEPQHSPRTWSQVFILHAWEALYLFIGHVLPGYRPKAREALDLIQDHMAAKTGQRLKVPACTPGHSNTTHIYSLLSLYLG